MLYFSPGTCSMAARIMLEESRGSFDLRQVHFDEAEQRTESFLKVNPLGRVPVLRLDDGERLVENTAILPYLGKRFGFWPTSSIEEAKALSLIGFFAANMHPTCARINRPERYTVDVQAFGGKIESARKSYGNYLDRVDRRLAGREYFLSEYSAVDLYGLVFYAWGVRGGYPMQELVNYTAFKDRLLQRAAIQRVLRAENIEV